MQLMHSQRPTIKKWWPSVCDVDPHLSGPHLSRGSDCHTESWLRRAGRKGGSKGCLVWGFVNGVHYAAPLVC